MKNTIIFGFVFTVFCLVSGAAAQTIGIYFDQDGTQPCYGDSTLAYPTVIEAFIVVKDLDPVAGLDGWEAKLSWSDNLVVSLVELYGQGMNFTTFPLCMVGLPSSIGIGSGTAALAKLYVIATGPGDLFVTAHDIPSIPGSELPVYTKNRAISLLNLEFGGISEPCASVGRSIEVELNSLEIILMSPFAALEIRDGVLYGLIESEKSWVALPSFESSNYELTQDEINLLCLVPTLGNMEQEVEKNNTPIFFDDFEGYVANTNDPFVPKPYYPKNFETDFEENQYGQLVTWHWGVTDQT